MKRKNKPSLRLLAITAAGILLCTGLLAAVLLQRQAASLQGSTVSEAPALPVALEEILAENTSPFTGLPLPDGAPEARRVTAVSIDGTTNGGPLHGLSAAAIVIEAVVDAHIPRLLALYEDYEAMPEVGPLRSARRQTFELVQPYQPILVSNGSNTWLNELLDDYEYGEWHLQYGTYLYRSGTDDPVRAYFTDGPRLAEHIAAEGIDASRAYNSSFFAFFPYGEERPLVGETAEEVFVPMGLGEEIYGAPYASKFLLDGDGRYIWHRYAGGSMAPVTDDNTGDVVAFDNLVILLAPMAPLGDAFSLVADFYGGVGFYCHNGSYEVLRWRKGGPLDALQLFYEDFETPYTLNPGTTYLALMDLEDATELYMGLTRE